MTPFVPSFRTVVGPFIWRFGSVANFSVPGRPPGPGGRAQQILIEEANRARIHRDDQEILELVTIISPCLS